jgi:hypothetical protein
VIHPKLEPSHDNRRDSSGGRVLPASARVWEINVFENRYWHIRVHSSQKVEAAQVTMQRRMYTRNVTHPCTGILCKHEKGGDADMRYNEEGP